MSLGRLLWLSMIAAFISAGLRAFVFEGIYIASASMEPTLPIGTHAILDKLTYQIMDPQRGDIISFTAPVPPYKEMVKRVIAVGGDTVELRDKEVLVNGAAQLEHYIQHTRAGEKLDGDTLGPLQVPKDDFFVLGDNRDESDDSTVWKDPDSGQPVYFVPLSKVRGMVRGFY